MVLDFCHSHCYQEKRKAYKVDKNIGKKIKLMRVSLDLKQSDLAKITGYSQNYISLIERQLRFSHKSVYTIFNILKEMKAKKK